MSDEAERAIMAERLRVLTQHAAKQTALLEGIAERQQRDNVRIARLEWWMALQTAALSVLGPMAVAAVMKAFSLL